MVMCFSKYHHVEGGPEEEYQFLGLNKSANSSVPLAFIPAKKNTFF